MKKPFYALLCIVMVFSMVACDLPFFGKKDADENSEETIAREPERHTG